jgi:excisionase family DNA binding protein
MMNKFQARKFYMKMFANYPDVLTVEDATNLLGFKSQTGVIRRIHQNRIRYLKVGRNFMIPKEYLIDKQYDPENFAAYPAGSQGFFCLLLSLYSEQHFRCFQVVWQSCFPVPA